MQKSVRQKPSPTILRIKVSSVAIDVANKYPAFVFFFNVT